MTVFYEHAGITIHHGDCVDVLATLPDSSVDSVVTDPPYELAFMGRKWDGSGIAFNPKVWGECLRVLKPGGHLLAFGGSRTWHRLTVAIEDAGFEIRDSIAWLYAQGFAKSLDVSKAIDKAAGAGRSIVGAASGWTAGSGGSVLNMNGRDVENGSASTSRSIPITVPATPAAQQWQGWGTALKPAHEPIVLARKPFSGTVAANVLEYGTGALNIDACRVATDDDMHRTRNTALGVMNDDGWQPKRQESKGHPAGRWPTNVVLDGDMAELLDAQSGILKAGNRPRVRNGDTKRFVYGRFTGQQFLAGERMDSGGASRFFPVFRYQAKASSSERPKVNGVAHPTVKPLALMRWLIRLVTPPGGVVLDPFLGSGTTAEAAALEGFRCIGIEREAAYLDLIRQRMRHIDGGLPLLSSDWEDT